MSKIELYDKDILIQIYTLIIKCYFLQNAHSTEQTPFTIVSPPGTHFTAESTEAMWIKCLALGQNTLMLLGFELSITVSRNRHLNHMTNMIYI